ncbi:MAG: F0F1 ATP synthase subunit delta [Chloroflexota bacterium]|nr:F0F1 ATP synthase subunit delta [Chloroflexota bacterium]
MLNISLSTLLLQVANFLILAYILTRFLFEPLKEMLDKRAIQVTKVMDEAEKVTREARETQQEYEKKRDNIDAEIAALKNEARIVIDQTRQQMLQEAYQEIEAMNKRAREETEQQHADALRLHRGKIGELVTALTQRMMQGILNPQIHQAYLDAFLDQLRTVQLNGRISSGGVEAVSAELITAIPATQENKTRIVTTLETMTPQSIDLACRVDPDLIAGAMVRLDDMLIDGSLQGQLQQLHSRYETEIGSL